MKSINKKYLLGFSIITCLVMGALVSQPVMSWLNPSAAYMGSSTDSAYVARNITTYTQDASVVIIGEVREISSPYIVENGTISQQDLTLDVKEVLKGDPKMTNITLLIEDEYAVEKSESGEVRFIPLEGENSYKPGEKILLFVGQLTAGPYVPYAGPHGKYLIDEHENVSGTNNFRMSLKDLRFQIQEALKFPAKEHIVIPVEEMY